MAAKLLICISSNRATVAVWRGRRFGTVRLFENSEAGWAAFAGFLGSARGVPIHILVDTVDEDYRFETLPQARGSERSEMVVRKLKQLYRTTPYFAYALHERSAGKRNDDRYLFAALTNTEILAPWMKAIEANALPVTGIYPLPMASIPLIERLKFGEPNLLLIAKNSAGLRQTFFKDSKFRISRLTPMRNTSDDADSFYAEEVGNTRMYLDALTVTHVDDVLHVAILDQDGSLSGLPAALSTGRPNVKCQYFSPAELQARLGIPAQDLAASADALHLFQLGTYRPPLNLAPAQVTRSYQRFAIRRWIYAAAAAVVLSGVIWGGTNAYQTMNLERDAEMFRRQTQDFQVKYRQVTAQFPDSPTNSENLRNIVEIANQMKSGIRTPETMLSIVSRALDASPDIQLVRIDWHLNDPKVVLRKGAAPAGNATTGAATAVQVQIGIVQAEVRPFDGDYRAAIETIRAFAAKIATHEKVAEVVASKLPLEVRSDTGLSGNTGVSERKESAPFELAVIFKGGA
jgi:hypothetical protein